MTDPQNSFVHFSAKGFTLLEVLVAMAIIGIALLALGRNGQLQINHLNALEERTVALWVADNVITQTRLDPKSIQAGYSRGSSSMAQRDWSWEMNIALSPDPGLWRLDVVVRNHHGESVLQHTGFSLREGAAGSVP